MEKHKFNIIYPAISFFIPFILYIIFLCPTIAGGDSPELITAAYVMGVPHPPGYPLYTIMGKLFTCIPFYSIAWRVNLMSAFLDSCCCLLVFLSLNKITRDPASSLCGSISLACSRFFWHYSEVAEVFALNNFFASLLIYILICWREKILNAQAVSGVRGATGYLYLFSFCYGLSLTNHHTMILLFPAFLFFILYYRRNFFLNLKVLLPSFLLFLTGLLPYIYLPLAAMREPPMNWMNPVNSKNFKAIILRENYGSLSLISKKIFKDFHIKPTSTVKKLSVYFTFLYHQFAITGLLLGITGLIYGFSKDFLPFNIFLLIAFFFCGPFFIILANMPVEIPLLLGVLHRFYIMSAVIFAFWIGTGTYKLFKSLRYREIFSVIITSICFLILFFSNLKEADFRDNYLAFDYGKNILSSLPEDSILFLKGDLPSMTIDYLQMVEGYRTDVHVIDQVKLHHKWYVHQIKKRFPHVIIPGERYDKKNLTNLILISSNIERYSIFFTDFEERTYEKKFKAIKWGLAKKIIPKDTVISQTEIEKQNKDIENGFIFRGLNRSYSPTSWESHIKTLYF
ncbi:MAG TPA: DUF2723 domain-containing protein [Candidatus Eremiobacteraeota bacterium]|mgnify:CR=1 FL=1|nr:DUF2723 domain-containing protein [Candidatus Eremiobacteraeota bacterium]